MFSLLAISFLKKSVWEIKPYIAELESTRSIFSFKFFSLIGLDIELRFIFDHVSLNPENLNLGSLKFLKKEP